MPHPSFQFTLKAHTWVGSMGLMLWGRVRLPSPRDKGTATGREARKRAITPIRAQRT